MLDILGFELTVPTAKIFLRRYVKATATENGADYHRCAMLAAYLAELTLPDYESLQFLPSQVGAMHSDLLGSDAYNNTASKMWLAAAEAEPEGLVLEGIPASLDLQQRRLAA